MSNVRNLVGSHPRLIASLAIGLIVGLFFPYPSQAVTRILTAWNVAVWIYLMQMGMLMTTAGHARVKRIAEQEDNNGAVVVAIMSIAATLSLVAIVVELASAKGLSNSQKYFHYFFTGLTVIGSWLIVATIFTFHYARMFYNSPADGRALRFPDDEERPTYWDFLYFSFTIAVAAQTSDITVMCRTMRKAVLAQSVLSFLFNAAIIGMSINIAAGLVGS